MEQSAVEWLVQEINKINVSTEARRFINKLEKQAKVMEKQQRYSEEEVKNFALQAVCFIGSNWDSSNLMEKFNEWSGQFKKK